MYPKWKVGFLVLFIGLCPLCAAGTDANPVPQTVLIVNFANLKDDINYRYLEISIPEALLSAIQQTKSFSMLPIDTWQNLVGQGVCSPDDNRSEQKARKAAITAQADVIVLGSFLVAGGELVMTARAINTESGRVIVSKNQKTKTTSKMFDAIDSLAADLATEMKEKLPPIPPKIIIHQVGDPLLFPVLWRNSILPGWGQIHAGNDRGWIYMGLFFGSLLYSGYTYADFREKRNEYLNLRSEAGTQAFDKSRSIAESAREQSYIALGFLLAAYLLPVTDGLIMTTKTEHNFLYHELGWRVYQW